MTAAETTIQTILTNNSIKWFPLVAPHDEPAPFVVYQEVSSNLNLWTLDGAEAPRSRWQIACWAYAYTEAGTLAGTVRGLFNLNTTNFEFAKVENRFDLPDPESGLYRKILEVYIWE